MCWEVRGIKGEKEQVGVTWRGSGRHMLGGERGSRSRISDRKRREIEWETGVGREGGSKGKR
jgi:hypothetical protein